MSDVSLQLLLMRMGSLLILAAIYGFSTAAAARLLGDEGPAQDGRMTLNPFAHLDMLGAVALVIFGLGWIRPLDVAPSRLHGGVLGAAGIVAVASLALLAAAAGTGLLLPLAATGPSDSAAPLAGALIATFAATAIGTALFNLLPVSPLCAGYVLAALWPAAAVALRRSSLVASLALIALLATGYPQRILSPATAYVASVLGVQR